MKIHQYFSILVVLMAVLFIAAALTPTASFAAAGDSKKSNLKSCPANCVPKTAVKYTKASNGTFKRQSARAQSNTVQKPGCVQCWTDTVSNWGTPATSGSGTNPRIVCGTCVPAWSLPATAARAPAKTTSNQTSNSGATTCVTCGDVTASPWCVPATSGTSVTYTPPAEPTQAATTTTTTTQTYRCGGLLCSILQVPYNIGAFVFGGCPMAGCS
jgi:hypothetical protein